VGSIHCKAMILLAIPENLAHMKVLSSLLAPSHLTISRGPLDSGV
jgi:hypothetical protein